MIRVAFVIGDYPPEERKRREDVALSYSSEELQVGIVSVPATPYIHGLTPAEVAMAATPFIHAFRDAERQGYDAVVPLGFLDLGVDGGKSAVDIPVVGPCEAALHVAAVVGDRFGAVVYHESLIPMTRAIVDRYGMQAWMAGYRASGFDLPDLAANHDRLVENFVAAARSLIRDSGANVIIPMGISQCPVHIKPDWLMKELGVPVIEGIGAPIRLAGLLAQAGLGASRVRWPKSPTVASW
ncbi:MAG TPA: aspartate/glutamate racemase family protein [Chloroflexota bacterium]|nr:aspartate/glutamate racemase family protein [Chloroflexota bacterium]